MTLRTYFLAQGPTTTCTLKSGQTPNVDKLMSTIDWSTAAQFADGREDNYQSTVLARLNIATAGEHTFRLTSDDGSVLRIDGNVVVDHDGLHGDTSKDGAVTLTAGNHDLRIDYIEAGGGQVLKLEWRAPGSSSFVVVPSSRPLHRGRRRARHRPGQQVLRRRDRHGRRRPAPGHGQPELHADRHPPARPSSRRSRAWTSCRTAAWS